MSDITNHLVKGERFNLSKESNGQTNFYIGLSWDAATANGKDADLDAAIFGCAYDKDENPKLIDDDHFVYYYHLRTSNGSIVHSGDNLVGGTGDVEQIRIYLDKLDPRVTELSVIVAIYDAVKKGQNFGQVKKPKIRICEMDSDGNPTTELMQFLLAEDYSKYTALQFGQIYKREDGAWQWNSTGAGFENAGFKEVCDIYAD